MEFRLARADDLPQLKEVFGRIIQDMNRKGIEIWDDVFPCEFFAGDIGARALYVLTEGETIVSAFALYPALRGEDKVDWPKPGARAMYLNRFGVSVDYARRGVGSAMLRHAAAIAREQGADALRLFVVDINTPAIRLYEKNGFRRAGGMFREEIAEDFVLNEYGYELDLSVI